MNSRIRLPKPPRGGFKIVLADPPWAYSNKGTRAAAARHYATLNIEDLMNLPVEKIAAANSILFLWATGPMIREAITLGIAWGFEYKTVGFTWAKRNRKANTAFFGMGNYTRANCEFCLIFIRGSVKVRDRGVPAFHWGPVLRHSEKPPAIREKIVRLMGDVARVELFSRHKVAGWHRFGNQLLPT